MNVLSLFDGMSCGRIALERVGVRVDKYYASEVDKHAISVSQYNYPDIKQIGCVKNVKQNTLPYINLLLAGSPCQGFSNMGAGLNFDDPKSKLFFEFIRIKKETNPDFFLLENVRMKKEWVKIISDMVGVEPLFINSKSFCAQSRPRIYWTNIPISPIPSSLYSLKDILQTEEDDSLLLDAKWTNRINTSSDIPKKFSRVDPDIAGCLTARMYANWKGNYISTSKGLRRLSPIECERLQTVPDNYTKSVGSSHRYKMLGNGWTVDVVAHILKGLKNKPMWEEI